eukprot:TRINITY_DN6412_c0_g2_i1.p1 TRINITY_DN6412_c0_g2~~TRINITY_DN6412_c0_g2_i1.p1  ORF type:complete len:251 (+),score=48.46 TRINITY_DN6412_c0_g2_i1:65-817(+)
MAFAAAAVAAAAAGAVVVTGDYHCCNELGCEPAFRFAVAPGTSHRAFATVWPKAIDCITESWMSSAARGCHRYRLRVALAWVLCSVIAFAVLASVGSGTGGAVMLMLQLIGALVWTFEDRTSQASFAKAAVAALTVELPYLTWSWHRWGRMGRRLAWVGRIKVAAAALGDTAVLGLPLSGGGGVVEGVPIDSDTDGPAADYAPSRRRGSAEHLLGPAAEAELRALPGSPSGTASPGRSGLPGAVLSPTSP